MCVKYELAQDMVVGNDWMLRGRAREARVGEAFLSSSPNVGSCVRFNIAHLEKLPPTGVTIIALPMKIKDGTGGPCRVIAILP